MLLHPRKVSLSLCVCLVGASSKTKCTEAQRRAGVGELKLRMKVKNRWCHFAALTFTIMMCFAVCVSSELLRLFPRSKLAATTAPAMNGKNSAEEPDIAACVTHWIWRFLADLGKAHDLIKLPFFVLGWLSATSNLRTWAHSKASGISQGPSSKAGEPFAAASR